MESKHTPGPWKVAYDQLHIVRVDAAHVTIANVQHPRNIDLLTAKANHKLMAAAPELLEALLSLLPHAEEMITHSHADHKKALAAIKKATT